MTVNLTKGGNVSLTKAAPGLAKIMVGLGWDLRTTTGAAYDLDACALIVHGAEKKVVDQKDFVYYGNLTSSDGTVVHQGDNLTGEGSGDDENILVDLVAQPDGVSAVVIAVAIFEAESRGQNFGQVRNAFIRVVDAGTNEELARFDLSEDASTETAMVFGEVYRNGDEWKFRALGSGYDSGLAGITADYGLDAV